MSKLGSKWMAKSYFSSRSYINTVSLNLPIELFDRSNIDSLVWPANEEGTYAKNFLTPLIKEGVKHYIDNIQTEMKVLKIDDLILPFTINDAEYDNCYVCSPYSYYISYAKASLDVIKNPIIRKMIKGTLWGISKIFKRLKINKVIIVNNWLLATNLLPKMDPKYIPLITQFLKQNYPQHAILFRSVDPGTNQLHYQSLKDHSFKLIATRQIFFTDSTKEDLFSSRIYKSDLRLLETSGYEVVDATQLTSQEVNRMLSLYRSVYIDHYSDLNPQFNQRYIELALSHKILELKAVKKEGVIDGVVGYVCRNGIMTCPLFGYDKSKPQQIGLYRILSTTLMLEAKNNQLLFHQSAGASTYKKIRKAQDCLEYTAVYHRHLPFTRKIPWILIRGLFNSLGIFFMKKY